jgi:hypothetical protein
MCLEIRPALMANQQTGRIKQPEHLRDDLNRFAFLLPRAARMAAEGSASGNRRPVIALVIITDEHAELPDEAHDSADSAARRGRAVAVNLIAATQRPTQAAMGSTPPAC